MVSKQFPKPNPPKFPKKKWFVFVLLMLVIVPSVAQASLLNSMMRVVASVYEKITNNTNPADEPSIQNITNSSIPEPIHSSTPIIPTDSATPDLLALLNAEFALSREDSATALLFYKNEAMKDNATAVFERALTLSIQLEDSEASLVFAQNWQQKNPSHIPALFYVTHLAIKAQNYPTAAQSLRQILKYDPKADLTQIFAGILPNTRASQLELLNALNMLDENNTSLSILKAGLVGQLGEPYAATLHLDNALADEPNNLTYLTLKADLLKSYDKIALVQFLQSAQKHSPKFIQKPLYLYHARFLIDEGRLSDAWQLLSSIASDFEEDGEILLLAGLVALDVNHNQEAISLFKKLLNNPTTKDEAAYYLALSFERIYDYKNALKYFLLVDNINFVLPATKKAVAIYESQGDSDKAIAVLIKLRHRYKIFDSESYLIQADILQRLGKKYAAVALLETAFLNNPDNPNLLSVATDYLDDKQDFDKKYQNYQKLAKIDPDDQMHVFNMARLKLAVNPSDADSLRAIVKMSYADEEYVRLAAIKALGDRAIAVGDFEGAINQLNMVYEQTPDLQIGITLLRAYQGLGNDKEVNRLLNDLTERFGGASESK